MDPNDVLNLMKNRRSIRKFKSDPISDEKLNQILEAARWCQSASNVQPWRFIIIRSKDILKKISKFARYGAFIEEAPLAIAIIADKKRAPNWYLHDTSMVSHQICLMAWALGIGTCWIGSLDREKASSLLSLSSNEYLTTILPLGYPVNDSIPPTPRKGLHELISEL